MRVRAAVLREMGAPTPYARSRPLQITDVELDGPGPGELLPKIGAAGLCHSDLSGGDVRARRGRDVVARARAATGGGADCVIETVGTAEVLAQACAATRRGGSTIAVEQLLTHHLALEDINEGFDRLARGEAVRQVVVF